jgi:hypothetical protein
MLIFCPQESKRFTYILIELLERRLGLHFQITDNESYFQKSAAVKLNYSMQFFPNCINIPPHELLFELNVKTQKINVVNHTIWKHIFFETDLEVPVTASQRYTVLPFDIFAASFYLLARYEEVLEAHKTDKYGRFESKNSLAFQHGFLNIPLIDYWVLELKLLLKSYYPELQFKTNTFRLINTIDIDFAYKFKGLSLFTRIKKSVGFIWRAQFKQIKNVWIELEKDPYDTYEELIDLSKHGADETIFFMLMANGSKYDQNIGLNSPELNALVQKLSANFKLGIHPSFQSHQFPKQLQIELDLLENLSKQKTQFSRQHFLKFKWPHTHQKLTAHGILRDYSMAYPDAIGFRASTAFPFAAFDLKTNSELPILVHSPCVMDVSLKNHLQLTPEQAIEALSTLKKTVQELEGEMISIWHNSSFDPTEGWAGWKPVYQSIFTN